MDAVLSSRNQFTGDRVDRGFDSLEGVSHHDIPPDIQCLPITHHSPVTRLPDEILASIFELYVGIENAGLGSSHASRGGPIRLIQVCKYWRTIVESYPCLWTLIHLDYYSDHSALKALDLYLCRSGVLPLSLTFICGLAHHQVDFISHFVDQLRAHAHRWKRISIQGIQRGHIPLLCTFTSSDLTSLKYLHISGNRSDIMPGIAVHLSLRGATKLESFFYGRGQGIQDTIDLHWQGLKELSFAYGRLGIVSRQFARNLAQCRNLVTLSFGIMYHQVVPLAFSGPPVIVFPCLRTLRARVIGSCWWKQSIIDHLVAPRLETLDIDSADNYHADARTCPDSTQIFSDLLARSLCSLCHLSIQKTSFSKCDVLRCLELSPNLTSFCFIPSPQPSKRTLRAVIHRLTTGRSRTWTFRKCQAAGIVVPQLCELTLASMTKKDSNLILAMIRSRGGACAQAAGVTALQRVRVQVFYPWRAPTVNGAIIPASRLETRSFATRHLRGLARWAAKTKVGNESEDEVVLEMSVVRASDNAYGG